MGLSATPPFRYVRYDGYFSAGDLSQIKVFSEREAFDACSRIIECRGVTYESSAPNGTITKLTTAYLKSSVHRAGGSPWSAWYKTAPVEPPGLLLSIGNDLKAALRSRSYTVEWLNVTRPNVTNLSFVPALSSGSALPLVQHLGDVTMRVRPAASSSAASRDWDFYASAWGPFSAEARPVPARAGEYAAHDITPLLEATDAPGGSKRASPLRVRRAYLKPADHGGSGAASLGIAFTLTNIASISIEVGAFGMSAPAAVSQDVHIGGSNGWVEWSRVHIAKSLAVDGQCVIATPLNPQSALENWRPIFEYGGGGFEWTVHSAAWAAEWERNVQWPFVYMGSQLNATGIWPKPRSPWPSWGDGGQTVRTNVTMETHWNEPTSLVLAPNESVTYGMRLSACPGGPRTRDAALAAMNQPVLKGVPGYTIAADMQDAALYVSSPSGVSVRKVEASSPDTLHVGALSKLQDGSYRIAVRGLLRGRSRLEVTLSDGSIAVAHYLVLPPLPVQISRVAMHWSEVAWLPRNSTDPFGRGASVLPWDREDKRHRFNDGRAVCWLALDPSAGSGC